MFKNRKNQLIQKPKINFGRGLFQFEAESMPGWYLLAILMFVFLTVLAVIWRH